MSRLEEQLVLHIRAARLPAPEREYVFAAPRRFRFDLAWPAQKLAVEVEGGTWVQGRHGRGSGMRTDAEKYNLAALAGWRVLRVTTDMVRDGSALTWIERALTATEARA